jgi:diguanylate cyclase (GGDEF)-like protein
MAASRPGRLRRRLYLHYASLYALILVLTAIAAQFVIADMAERSVAAALRSSAAVFERLSVPRDAAFDMVRRTASIPLNAAVISRSDSGDWRSALATVPGGIVQRALSRPDGETVMLALAGGPSIALIRPLGTGEDSALLLSYPLDAAIAPFRGLQLMLALAGAAGMLLVLAGSWAIARAITQPVALLDRAVHDLRDGTATMVPVHGNDEIARLAESFNDMARFAHLALHDALTGLPNRAFFRQRLEAALENPAADVALLCVDLDGFKAVNDSLGHPVGDEVLKIVALRMESVAGGAMVARLGGDEFTIILPGADEHEAERVAGRTIDAIRQPAIIDGQRIRIGASIGIAYHPRDATDPTELLRRADQALYIAKAAGRGVAHSYGA